MITQAFILGAGFGTRMLPLSQDKPKPMVLLNGKPIIGYILDKLKNANVTDVVVNLHAHAPVLSTYLDSYTGIRIHQSFEDTILNTGGGLQTGIPYLPKPHSPFFAINGDAFWEGENSLNQLSDQWYKIHQDKKIELLLLLQNITRMPLTPAIGDYTITQDQRAHRCKNRNGTHMFTGIRIIDPKSMNRPANHAFSFLEIMDEIQENQTLYAHDHKGLWHHISTPQDVETVADTLRAKETI